MARPRTYVEAPPVTPLPYGLLSAALVIDDLAGHAQMGVQYEPAACGNVHLTRAACEDEAAEFDQSHTGVPLVEGDPFNLYSLFVCTPVGLGEDGLRAKAGEALRAGEGRAVEAALAERLPLAAGAVDLTPTDAVHPVDGAAILEGFAAANYGGVPTLHIPRNIGTVLTTVGTVDRYQSRLETKQGALVASGGGYDLVGPPTDVEDPETVQAPGDGEAWMYVTGTVVVRRAPTAEATPVIMSRRVAGDTAAASNDAWVLAVRPYVVTWECVTAAVRVTTGYGIPT